MSLQTETSHTGRATRRAIVPRTLADLLALVRHTHPGTSQKENFSHFLYEATLSPALIRESFQFWHALHFKKPQPKARRAVARPAMTTEQRVALKNAAKSRIVEVVFLNMPMPNGKKLRDCTGAECLKFGGWLAEIGKRCGPRRHVSDVLSEDQVAKIYKKQ
jgi:hypothetical protein